MRTRRVHPRAVAQRGITLIELMIVVAVIAIITAVAYPSYQDHIRKARRAEGKTALLKALQLEERFYTAEQTYTLNLVPLFGASGTAVMSGENPASGNYTLTAEQDPDVGNDLRMGVLLKATPAAPFSDVECGVLTITTTGARTANGTKGTASTTPTFCWER